MQIKHWIQSRINDSFSGHFIATQLRATIVVEDDSLAQETFGRSIFVFKKMQISLQSK